MQNTINDNKHVLIKTISKLSYSGEYIDKAIEFNNTLYIVIKQSKNSNILMHIPVNEIDKLYLMNGQIIKGDEINEQLQF